MKARSTFMLPALLSIVLLSAATMVAPAAAQTPDPDAKAAAEALFNEGRTLMKAGRFAEACDKFESSNRFDPSVGTLLNLGVCREQTGQTAIAWEVYRSAAEMAQAAGDGRESYARERMSAVAEELHFIVIEVPEQARLQGLQVLLDDAPVPARSWGRPLLAEAGSHVVQATAPGRVSFEQRVETTTPGQEAGVEVPVLAQPAPEPAPPAETEPEAAIIEETPPPAPGGGAPMPTRRKLALGSGAAGVVGLVAGGILGMNAGSTYDEAEEICPAGGAGQCTATARADSQEKRDQARSRANLATAAAAIGVAALAAGAILWYTTPPAARETATPAAATTRIAPMLGGDVAGMTLHTTF